MKLIATMVCLALASGCLLLDLSPANAFANMEESQNSCMQAALCSQQAQNEKYDANNPGMGPKFNALRARCQRLAAQCARDAKAPEPRN